MYFVLKTKAKEELIDVYGPKEALERLHDAAREAGSASLWMDGKEAAHGHVKGAEVVVTII